MRIRSLTAPIAVLVALCSLADQGQGLDRTGAGPAGYPEYATRSRSGPEANSVAFTKNCGQWPDSVLFRADSRGAVLWFTGSGVYCQVMQTVREGAKGKAQELLPHVRQSADATEEKTPCTRSELVLMEFVSPDPGLTVAGDGEIAGRYNYFLGSDPAAWKTDVPAYSRIVYRGLRPGLELCFAGDNGQVECHLAYSAGADASPILMSVSAPVAVSVSAAGDLEFETEFGPAICRPLSGLRFVNDVEATYAVSQDDSRTAAFAAPASLGLFYGTYIGGSGGDWAWALDVDESGYAYVAGYTLSADFPTQDPYQQDKGSDDVFVVKLNPSGNALIYATYLGGALEDAAFKLDVTASGSVYVTGRTASSDFPTVNPYQTHQGGRDVFVAKLNAAGNGLEYSTYLGGALDETAFGLSVDVDGNAFVAGRTASTDFPTQVPLQADQGGVDCFVTKLNAAGNGLLFSTYLGGSLSEEVMGLSEGPGGDIYVVGWTSSSDFPKKIPFQAQQGGEDGFVVRLPSTGDSLIYATYLGGGSDDRAQAVAVDGQGNAYVAGLTLSSDFPTQGPYQTDQPDYDAFVVKLVSEGDSLAYGTYFGGSFDEYAYAIAADNAGNACVAGISYSSDLPTVNKYQDYQGEYDAFVLRLNAAGDLPIFSTYVGGADYDFAEGVAQDGSGNVWLAGITFSTDFPIQNPYQTDQGSEDIFVVKLCADLDVDCIPDAVDNCPEVANSDQADADLDLVGDACDACPLDPDNDIDADGFCGNVDNCPTTANSDQADADLDLVGDACDACPLDPDNDIDADGVCGNVDNCPTVANPGQEDSNHDGTGDACTVCPITMTGDVNLSNTITSADVIGLVNYVFKGGATPLPCIAAGDVNCSGTVTSADIIGLVGFVFKSGAPPCDGCTSPLAAGC